MKDKHRWQWNISFPGACAYIFIDKEFNSSRATFQEKLIIPAACPSLSSLFNRHSPCPHTSLEGSQRCPLHMWGCSVHSNPSLALSEFFSGLVHTDQPHEMKPVCHPKHWGVFAAQGTEARNRWVVCAELGGLHCVVRPVASPGMSPASP